ncbi:MAG: CHRD domain-containing protein [Acidobacteria bacterium]|nr:CHRD domain-containing protein [Acidobacteriota bacterium]
MIKNVFKCGFLPVFLTLAVMVNPAMSATQWYTASLSGSRIVGAEGDHDAMGVGVIGIGDGMVMYWIVVDGIEEPTAAHIHDGSAGVNGGVVIDLGSGFSAVGDGAWMASGSTAIDPGLSASMSGEPENYYFQVHNASFPAGAVRSQVLGDAPPAMARAATLRGHRQVGQAGDSDGKGFGALFFEGGVAHYFISVEDIDSPTAAHIHAGDGQMNGGVVLTLDQPFENGMTTGSVEADSGLAFDILKSPDDYYFNIHNAAFPAGAVRGQLRPGSSVVSFPVASRAQGQAGSNWRTDVRILNLEDEDAMVRALWYPSNSGGLDGPAVSVGLGLGAESEGVFDDVVGDLFGANGNGAIRILAPYSIRASARVFNDQRDNPDIGGTFGQFAPGFGAAGALSSGVLLLGTNTPVSAATGWRGNAGYFNPSSEPVEVIFTIRSVSGEFLGSDTRTLAPWSNRVTGVFTLVPSVPQDQRERDDFVLSFSANAPIFVYLSVVDNVTSDAIFISPVPAPGTFSIEREMVNSPPSGTITSPDADVSILAGESVNFEATAEDPDGDDLTYLWDFDDGTTSSMLLPGDHTFDDAGVFTVTFTVTDSEGAADQTPDSRTITVQSGGNPDATLSRVQAMIFTQSCAFSGCHAGGSPAQGMNLEAGQAFANIVGVASHEQPDLNRIEPGSPETSYLYLKVTGDSSITGSRMPLGGAALGAEEIELLRDWIVRGAPND